MTKAIRIHQTGGPSVMQVETVETRDPGPGELRIRHAAIGVNFIDTYHRSGLYPVPLPAGIGLEASGTVDAIGAEVSGFQPGDRVAYGGGPLGAYAEVNIVPAGRVARLPDAVSFDQAAAIMLKGMTARYLLKETYAVKPGDTILFHAAAGGVGLLVCQWARELGATVIGTAGSEEKCALARSMGATHMIN